MIHLVWPLFGRKENKVRDTEGDDQFWSINAAHVACLLESDVSAKDYANL